VPLSQAPELAQMVERVRTETLGYLKTEVKDRFARLREHLSEDEQMLLVLRVDRDLGWNDIAVILADGESLSGAALQRRAAGLRKQFQRTKEKLSKLARSDGLL
jgi:DNA-directed RNA polymerase specialized sigma24 family protein